MSLSGVKIKALTLLLNARKPLTSPELAQQLGLEVRRTNLHLIWLKKKGYVFSPEKGLYAITEKGKEVTFLPKTDRKQALQILRSVPIDEAFHFYRDINQYLGIYANSLNEFRDKIQVVDATSIAFHLPRKDFESWFSGLGDPELAKRMSAIRESGLLGEDLRKRVYEAVKSRCEELEKLTRELSHS